jgi:hypothetical protein
MLQKRAGRIKDQKTSRILSAKYLSLGFYQEIDETFKIVS